MRNAIERMHGGMPGFVTGRVPRGLVPLDEWWSEARFAFVRAIEFYDHTRGFRFPTFAYTAIARALVRLRRGYRAAPPRLDRDESAEGVASGSRAYCPAEIGELRELLSDPDGVLTDLERHVLCHRYGIGTTPKTIQEVADALSVSFWSVTDRHATALRKLRAHLSPEHRRPDAAPAPECAVCRAASAPTR